MTEFEDSPIGRAIIDLRHRKNGDFNDPQHQGQRGCDWDAGLIAVARALEAKPELWRTTSSAGLVEASVYEAAVKGRQDFRKAYRDLLPIQRAAQAVSDAWRSPVDIDTLYDLVNALDIAVTGGGPTTPEMKQAIAARYTAPAVLAEVGAET